MSKEITLDGNDFYQGDKLVATYDRDDKGEVKFKFTAPYYSRQSFKDTYNELLGLKSDKPIAKEEPKVETTKAVAQDNSVIVKELAFLVQNAFKPHKVSYHSFNESSNAIAPSKTFNGCKAILTTGGNEEKPTGEVNNDLCDCGANAHNAQVTAVANRIKQHLNL